MSEPFLYLVVSLSRERQSVFRKEDCSPFNISTVYRVLASFTDAEKFRSIKSV